MLTQCVDIFLRDGAVIAKLHERADNLGFEIGAVSVKLNCFDVFHVVTSFAVDNRYSSLYCLNVNSETQEVIMIKLTLQGYVHFYRDELENDWHERGGNGYMDWHDYLNEKYEEYCEFWAEMQQ